MQRWYARRFWIYAALGALLLLDALIYFGWLRNPAAFSEANPALVASWERAVAEGAAEVTRLETVREQAPRLGPQLDQFITDHLLPERTGYSQLAADMEDAAVDAGIYINQSRYRSLPEKQYPQLVQIEINASVEGTYSGLLRYLATLERSPRFYLINELRIAGRQGGRLQVEMRMATYFRRLRTA